MEEKIAISIKNLNKTFNLQRRKPTTIREKFLLFKPEEESKKFRAIKDINLDIFEGETFGIIGRNGSGKSTLINLIMGSISKDKGSVIKTSGTIIRLALGMGMDPQMTARENIYVNGSVIGLSFKKIGESFQDIIDYAGIEKFVDEPVNHFSNGMQARLKFSIAMYANADIFLLDEFIGGVGDEDFKLKSEKAFTQRILENKTNVIVSHSMGSIKKYCTRVAWIDNGAIKAVGPSAAIVQQYQQSFKLARQNKNKA